MIDPVRASSLDEALAAGRAGICPHSIGRVPEDCHSCRSVHRSIRSLAAWAQTVAMVPGIGMGVLTYVLVTTLCAGVAQHSMAAVVGDTGPTVEAMIRGHAMPGVERWATVREIRDLHGAEPWAHYQREVPPDGP